MKPESYKVYNNLNFHSNSLIFLGAMLKTSYFFLNMMHIVKTQRFWEFFVKNMLIITALHGMQTRSSDENSACLFVCPFVVHLSNACIMTKQKKNMSRFLYHTEDNLA